MLGRLLECDWVCWQEVGGTFVCYLRICNTCPPKSQLEIAKTPQRD